MCNRSSDGAVQLAVAADERVGRCSMSPFFVAEHYSWAFGAIATALSDTSMQRD